MVTPATYPQSVTTSATRTAEQQLQVLVERSQTAADYSITRANATQRVALSDTESFLKQFLGNLLLRRESNIIVLSNKMLIFVSIIFLFCPGCQEAAGSIE